MIHHQDSERNSVDFKETNNDMEEFFNIIPSLLAIVSSDGYLKK